MEQNSEFIERSKSQSTVKRDVWSSLPLIGKHIDARRDFKQKRDRFLNYDLDTLRGQQRELDIIEEVSGSRFRARPGIEFINLPSGGYEYRRNVIKLYSGFMRPADRRAMLWHESGHAFVMQNPLWAEFSPESLSPGDSSEVDPFIRMRNAVINEGLAMVIEFHIADRLTPFLSEADASNLREIKRKYLEPIDKEEFIRNALKTQGQIAEGMNKQKTQDTQNSEAELVNSLRKLNDVMQQTISVIELNNFLNLYGRKVGYHWVFEFSGKIGTNELDKLIKAIAEDPPQNWESFFEK